MTRVAFATVLLLMLALSAKAHPLLEIHYDRTVAVRLDPDVVRVTYTVEMNLLAMALDGKSVVNPDEIRGKSPDSTFVNAYAARKGMLIADGLTAMLDGKALKFQLDGKETVFPEPGNTFRIIYKFRAPFTTVPGKAASFAFEDFNFDDQPGGVWLTIDEGQKPSRLSITNSVEPLDLRGKSNKGLTAEELNRRKKCSAEFVVAAATADNPLPKMPVEVPAPDSGEKVNLHERREPPGIVSDLWDRGLVALFDSTAGVTMILLMAFVFGMGHALTPGHGKTMVAAYLVGERGTSWHAVVLGLTSTLAHTGSVIILAAVLYSAYGNTAPASAQAWLNLAGGSLIFLVGLWLFLQRVRGKADHVHLFADAHHHHHHHHHQHEPGASANGASRYGWVRIIMLGLGGGIIPCWDAVLLFLLAMAQGRIGFALPVLFAFSTGLAAILIALGLAVVYARKRGATRFGEHRWFRLLPIASALVLLGMGVWFLRDGWQALSQAQ